MTWYDDTLSLVGNPRHPCFHADPKVPDLAPRKNATIRGKVIFFDGPLKKFNLVNYRLNESNQWNAHGCCACS
jgi:hypothetical protein